MRLSNSWPALTSWVTLLLLGVTNALYISNNVTESISERRGLLEGRADDFYLRILPLGASITHGVGSSHGNGYRKYLRDQLRWDGWKVNMVGTKNGGNMADSDNEGWSGYRVDEVRNRAENVMTLLKPNLVLINAGTNDATQNYYVDTIEQRMRDMLTYIFRTVPTTTVILSTLVPHKWADANVRTINDKYRALVSELQRADYHIILAEMHNGWLTTADLDDDTHPNDSGFKKMAASWHNAINAAEAEGWLQAPDGNVNFDDSKAGDTHTCQKVIGSGNQDPRGATQILKALSPRIIDDGKYQHSSQSMGVIHQGFYTEPDDVWFAQLVNLYNADRGGERDDWVFSQPDGLWMRINMGGGSFGDKFKIDVKRACPQKGIRWGDVNNDGLDDFICLDNSGNMYVSINTGGNPPQFRDVGLYKSVPGGYSQTNVRLGDIDGDGRLDYCVIAGNGNIFCWRNGGQGDMADYWQDFGQGEPVFTGKGMGNIDGVRLVDINGDFRSDWLWLDDNGQVTTYINQRNAGKGLIPHWDSVGVTHGGMGEPSRSQIRFARLYDSGRADYVYIKCTKYENKRCDYEVRAWKNTGGGGKHQKGDGARFCDMTGSGNDDYVFIDHHGRITIFKNVNTPPNTNYAGWEDKGIVLETGLDRKSLHLADWNGDGKCDIIAVTKATGALDVWYTSFNWQTGAFSFSAKTRVVENACTQGWGVGPFDLGMRFPDIDGDGRADYMCLEKDGRTTGWLNKPEGLKWMNQIKFSVGKDRANHRWADVNGDGRDDFMWSDKFNGNTEVWYNMGEREISGSTFWWDPKGPAYLGSASGPNLMFPNLGGVGRADMLDVNPKTGTAVAWFNSCPGGDDGPLTNPELGLLPAPVPPPVDDGTGDSDDDDDDDPVDPIPSYDNCLPVDDIFFTPNCIGSTEGGSDFCDSEWGYGTIINGFEVWSNNAVVRGIRFFYSDGTKSPIRGREDSHRHQEVSWDAFGVTVKEMFVTASSRQNGRVGMIELLLSDGTRHALGATYAGTRYFIPPRQGFIMGAHGKQGFDVDCLAFRFLTSEVKQVLVSDTEFTESLDDWNSQQKGMSRLTRHDVYYENKLDHSYNYEVSSSYTKVTTNTVAVTNTWKAGGSLKFKVDARVPIIGSAINGEGNALWEYTRLAMETDSQSFTEQIAWKLPMTVPPHETFRCLVITWQGSYDGSFWARITVRLENENTIVFKKRGHYDGISSSGHKITCDKAQTVPDGARIVQLT